MGIEISLTIVSTGFSLISVLKAVIFPPKRIVQAARAVLWGYFWGLPKKGFPPLCIQSNQPNHPTIGAGAETAQSRPKEKKEKIQEKQTPTMADRQRNEEASWPLHPPEISHQTPSLRSTGTNQHLQEGTRRRRRCCQGFPPVR